MHRSCPGLAAITLSIAAALSCGPALAQSSAWDKMNESLAQGASGSISDKKKEFQADGLSIGSGALSGSISPGGQSIKPSAAVSAGTSPAGALGSQYTGSADPALTGSASKGSLVGIGQQAQGASNSAVATRGGYSNDRANQADDAVHFLSQHPVPRVPVDESFRGAARSATGPSGFGSSSSKDCKQVDIPTANEGTTETIACLQVLTPYILDSCTETTTVVKSGEVWQCNSQEWELNLMHEECIYSSCNTTVSSRYRFTFTCDPDKKTSSLSDQTVLQIKSVNLSNNVTLTLPSKYVAQTVGGWLIHSKGYMPKDFSLPGLWWLQANGILRMRLVGSAHRVGGNDSSPPYTEINIPVYTKANAYVQSTSKTPTCDQASTIGK